MSRHSFLHANAPNASEDGTRLAVTLIDRAPRGVMVWAGRLCARAARKRAHQISPADYTTLEKVSFRDWDDVWEYFASREYAPLLRRLRERQDGPAAARSGRGES